MKQTLSVLTRNQKAILHIGVLCAFALAQPMFDLLSRNAEFFAVRHSSPEDIILITLLLIFAAPIAAGITLWLFSGLNTRLHNILFYMLLSLLMTLVLLPPLNSALHLHPWAALTISASTGISFAFYYYRKHAIRLLLTLLSPSIVLFPALFLFNSPVYSLLDRTQELPTVSHTVASDVPVVMVIFDELPLATLTDGKTQLDSFWFPNFAALAGQGNWYRNASTVADYTTHAVPAILTGNYPRVADRPGIRDPKASFDAWLDMPTARDHPDNLFTLLGDSYRLEVHETVSSLCPESFCGARTDRPKLPERLAVLITDLGVVYAHIVTPPEFTIGLPSVTMGWTGFIAEHGVKIADDTNDFMRFVDAIDSQDIPTLYFHHSTLPHRPWVYLPSGERHNSEIIPGLSQEVWGTDEALIDRHYQRHFLQARYADRLLGILLQKLRSKGLYDRSLIVVTADHGVSFEAGTPLRRVTHKNHHDIISIPLIIKMPNQSVALIDDRPAQTIDILPTIVEVLGTTPPYPVDGQSLLIQPTGSEKPRTIIDKRGRKFTFDFHYSNESGVRSKKKAGSPLDFPNGQLSNN